MSIDTGRRFTTTDFVRMFESGIFHPDDRVELIDGVVRNMSPIGRKHIGIVIRLDRILQRLLHGRATISVQSSIELSRFTEPQPDIVVLRFRDDDYMSKKPDPEDALLIIEVADSSLVYDRDEKMPVYAAAGVPEYWIIDVQGASIIRFTQPVGSEYQTVETVVVGQQIDAIPSIDMAINASEILAGLAD